jgi:hypothetical protein
VRRADDDAATYGEDIQPRPAKGWRDAYRETIGHLGTTLATATGTVADARLKEVRSRGAGSRRRALADASARKRSVDELRAEIAAAASQIEDLPGGDTSAPRWTLR